MINKRKKTIACIVALVFLLSICTVSLAQGQYKQITAWIGDVKIINNGASVNMNVSPLIIDGTTYVPVRALSDIFEKEVGWNGDTHTVILKDKTNTTVAALRQQLTLQNIELSSLRSKIEKLEEENEELEEENEELEEDLDDDEDDLDDLEDNLNDDYEDYEDIEFDISLSGDEDDITVRISVDLDEYDDEWDDLSTSDKEDYLQDIVDDILDEYEDADVEGYIRDSSRSSSNKLLTFTVSWDEVDLDMDDDLSDLEDELDENYDTYLEDDDIDDLSIELEYDEDDDIIFYVYIDYDRYEDEWEDLSDSEIRSFMSHIYADIEDEYDDEDIVGYIYDEDDDDLKLVRYCENLNGNGVFSRYVD